MAWGDQLGALAIGVQTKWLGEQLNGLFTPDPSDIIALNPFGTTFFDLSVNPGQSDFEWILGLSTNATVDASETNKGITLDFSHTIEVTYDGPDGTTTRAAQPFSNLSAVPSGVPVPSSALLVLGGMIALTGRKRFRKVQRLVVS